MGTSHALPREVKETIDSLPSLKTLDDIRRAAPRIRALMDHFAATEEARVIILESITPKHSPALLGFAHLEAEVSVRENSEAELRRGLLAIVLECAADYRDTLQQIALLYHSCRKIGADANELFRDASDLAEGGIADLLIGFLRRPARERELESWSYREGTGPEGFTYESTVALDDLSDWMDKKA